jgi:hypothetical protein
MTIETVTDYSDQWNDFWEQPAVNDYHKVLRDKLCDIVAEYMADDKLSPQNFVDDVNAELKGWIDYYEKGAAKATEMHESFGGTSN